MNFLNKVEYYKGETANIDAIRSRLINYNGGEITYEKNCTDGIAKICINHPEKKNAISGKMMTDFEKIVNDLEIWSNGKAVILYGANDIFCSGGDLNFAKKENTAQSGYEMAFFMQKLLYKFSNLPIVSVAYVSGTGAIGGGAELITACDFRLCSSEIKTKIGYVHNKMGIVPAWGGTKRLVDIVGKRKALNLILSGTLLNNNDALNVGLIDDIVDNFDDAYSWIQDKVKAHSSVTRATKACVVNGLKISEDVWETERRIFAPLWGGSANKAALEMNIKHVK